MPSWHAGWGGDAQRRTSSPGTRRRAARQPRPSAAPAPFRRARPQGAVERWPWGPASSGHRGWGDCWECAFFVSVQWCFFFATAWETACARRVGSLPPSPAARAQIPTEPSGCCWTKRSGSRRVARHPRSPAVLLPPAAAKAQHRGAERRAAPSSRRTRRRGGWCCDPHQWFQRAPTSLHCAACRRTQRPSISEGREASVTYK